MKISYFILVLSLGIACAAISSCGFRTAGERAVYGLAGRIVPEYASNIVFKELKDTLDTYSIQRKGSKLLICGSNANALAAGLGRYLKEIAGVDVSWETACRPELPHPMPLPNSSILSRAIVPQRFFLNYCTFGYTMPWWKWEEWERFIDWMALQGINLPLALTGQEAVLRELWRKHGIDDEAISSWFTGPAHLPWHRMCNIDGVDGPLPQGWIDGQEALQKRILKRERELGMRPVLPAFSGHVPKQLTTMYPDALITDIRGWCGFSRENLPAFLSPQDSLFAVLQKEYLEIQTGKYGSDHLYGFDLFNEIEPPTWNSEVLSDISRKAFGSLAAADPDALWIQMGWMFWNDRRHWTPELVKAYLDAVPKGKVIILDYYTEAIPVWTLTDSFFGQPFIFCYLGNFGGNNRLAGPFRKESERITKGLKEGGASGIGCTLEGFGVNRWFYEYVMERAWSGTLDDDSWLASLDRRRHSPEGFWKEMADSIYLRGSFSEGPLICGRPCLEGYHNWTVINNIPYSNRTLANAWAALLESPSSSEAWRFDAVNLGCQALGNHFSFLRDTFVKAWRNGNEAAALDAAGQMRSLLEDVDALAECEPSFRLDKWLEDASGWARSEEEKQYYRHNAWHILTTWGYTPTLNDYASRLWSGLVREYYAPRWELFIDEILSCMKGGRGFSQEAMDLKLGEFEQKIVDEAPVVTVHGPAGDVHQLCNELYHKWFENE